MHNLSGSSSRPATAALPAVAGGGHAAGTRPSPRVIPHPSAARVRKAEVGDVAAIVRLIAAGAAEGLMLPRAESSIAEGIEQFVVAEGRDGVVLACAALEEYSPSLGEVAAVAVAPPARGRGIGTAVVQAVERMARQRQIPELFALSLSDEFFETLGYALTSVSRYPEKLARYEALVRAGVPVVPRRCWRKVLS